MQSIPYCNQANWEVDFELMWNVWMASRMTDTNPKMSRSSKKDDKRNRATEKIKENSTNVKSS